MTTEETTEVETETDDFLAHYGVPGMKWGKRKGSTSTADVHGDAASAKDARERAKKSGTSSLSNQELQALVTRTNLEQQYSKLNPSKFEKGHTKVKAILGVVGTVSAIIAIGNSPAGQLARKAMKS